MQLSGLCQNAAEASILSPQFEKHMQSCPKGGPGPSLYLNVPHRFLLFLTGHVYHTACEAVLETSIPA